MPPELHADRFDWELAAEAIAVKVRWFGLCMGYVLVNFIGREINQPVLNAILTLGAVYAVVDTYWSLRRRVFLSDSPLVISLMEAVFIGLLCHFDQGIESPFRFYYFLSLLVCAMRYAPAVTWTTFGLHAISYGAIALSHGVSTRDGLTSLVLTLVLMGWMTWASTSLAALVKAASRRLAQLNSALEQNQALLEERIGERTRELQESQALLVQQEKQAAFGLLAAGIAHEVGNPLAAISSLVQMMNRRPTDDYTREKLPMVDAQLRRIQRTLRELVDFSRPATTELGLCEINSVIDEALNIAKYYKRKKGKQISARYADGLPRIRVVRDQLVQVFLNLILNAMDATEEGGTIEISTSMRAGDVCVSVRDDGHGISPKDREAIFDPYFTTKKTGTGLGLFVCRNLLEQVGGGIELCDTTDQGTTFHVFLPCSPASSDPSAPAVPAAVEEIAST